MEIDVSVSPNAQREEGDSEDTSNVKHYGLYPVASLGRSAHRSGHRSRMPGVCIRRIYGAVQLARRPVFGHQAQRRRLRGDLRRRLSPILRAVHDFWGYDTWHDVPRITGGELLRRVSVAAAIFATQHRIRIVGGSSLRRLRVVLVGRRPSHVARSHFTHIFELAHYTRGISRAERSTQPVSCKQRTPL